MDPKRLLVVTTARTLQQLIGAGLETPETFVDRADSALRWQIM